MIEIPILNKEYKVIVVFGGKKKVAECLKKYGYALTDTTYHENRGYLYYNTDCHPVIALPRRPKTPEEIGTLAHEAVHAVSHIFDYIHEHSRDEVFAHSVGAIVRESLK